MYEYKYTVGTMKVTLLWMDASKCKEYVGQRKETIMRSIRANYSRRLPAT